MKVFSRVVSPLAVNFLGSAGSVFLMLWWDLLFMLLAVVMWWMLTIHARHGFHFLAEVVQVSVEEICSQMLIYCIMCLSMPKLPKPLSMFQAPRLKHTKTHARAKDCSMEYRQVPIPYSCHKHQRWHLSKMVRWLVSQRSAMGPGAGQVFVSWLRGLGMEGPTTQLKLDELPLTRLCNQLADR